VQALEFVGMLERVRLTVRASAALTSALRPDAEKFVVEATRSARDAEITPLAVGQSVSLGVKRVHVLPTPISSLRVLAATQAESERIESSPLIRELTERMHISPVKHRIDGDVPFEALGGLSVIALERAAGLAPAVTLLEQGAHQVLGVGEERRRIERLLIYIQPTRPARDAALAAAGTLLRHLAVDATLLVPAAERRSLRGSSYRDLLDIRHSALRTHGVDVRTESFDVGAADAIRERLVGAAPTLLLIGVTSATSGRGLIEELGAALEARPPAAAMIVRGSVNMETGIDASSYVLRPAAVSTAGGIAL
jgi:sulfate/thiosulfate transport system ATP-binding protein